MSNVRYDYTTAPGFIQEAAGEDIGFWNNPHNLHNAAKAPIKSVNAQCRALGDEGELATNKKFDQQLTELMAIVHAPTQESSTLGYNS